MRNNLEYALLWDLMEDKNKKKKLAKQKVEAK
jgi:hypothetical protein